MTVNTVSPAIISRAEFNLNAGQTKTPQLVRMDFTNLVTNGGFDTDVVGWTANGSGDITFSSVSSKMEIVRGAGGVAGYPYQEVGLVEGRKYLVSAEVVGAGAVFHAGTSLGGLEYGQITAAAPDPDAFTATTASVFLVSWANTSSTSTLDNVTLYEADPSDDAPWLRLPYGYSVGRTGWIVRDGVILHPSDYTEVKDSGQTWIKPLVAPGVSTEFSIWGSPSYAV